MAKRLTTDIQIDDFISKIIVEAQHHAPQVANIIRPLSDAVRGRLNLLQDRVEVFERNGSLARTCWVTVGKNRYVFSYNYQSFEIQLKCKNTHGAVKFLFNNGTPHSDILQQTALL